MIRSPLLCAIVLASLAAVGCGPGNSQVGGGGGGAGGGGAGGGGGTGGGGGQTCTPLPELCDGLDNDCDGQIDEGFDADGDGFTACAGDCDDSDPAINSTATEVQNGKDDNCDGKVDNHIAGLDFDKDGTPFPTDCNDDEPLVGPLAVEVGGDSVDNNCDGQVDETPPSCETGLGTTAADFAKAIGMCSFVTGSQFVRGDATARAIRQTFGDQWTPKQGNHMIQLSTGLAVDLRESPTYLPQDGHDFKTTTSHPLYSAPRCGTPASCDFWSPCTSGQVCKSGKCVPEAKDSSELKLTLKVPANANSFSFQFNFFSAEYPEYVCTKFNDRFIVLLESNGLDVTKLPSGQCDAAASRPTCNISYDSQGQPVTINNGFFDVCQSASGTGWSNPCSKSPTLLANTGYDKADPDKPTRLVGGATGWLSTKAPVKPGETITLRFIIFDEGDGILDSTALIDNFKWEAQAVTAPVTDPVLN